MLLRMCELISDALTPDVRVIGPASKYEKYGVKCVVDRWPGEGPLGGIVTGLLEAGENQTPPRWNLFVSCDMPFLTEEMLVFCVDRAKKSDAQVVVPRSAKGLEPLCACWRTGASAKLLVAFEQGVRRVTEGMKHLEMEVLDEREWKRFYNAERLFWNMNTPADYNEAKRILESGRG